MSGNSKKPYYNPAAKAIYRAMKSEEANCPLPTAHGEEHTDEVTEKTPTLFKSLLAMQRGEWSTKVDVWDMRLHIADVHAGPKPRFKKKRRAPKKKERKAA